MSESDLIDRVEAHPRLSGSEKETSITMYGDEGDYTIYTAKPTIVKSLLKHDYFEMGWAQTVKNEEVKRISSKEELKKGNGDIVAVEGALPIGTLTVKSKPRANDHQSSIVSAETIDPSVFED